MTDTTDIDTAKLVEWRRRFHRYPEPGWREFLTTVRIVEELEQMVDEIHVGPDALASEERLGVPDESERSTWFENARDRTDRTDILDRLAGGHTGAVAVINRGDGPTVGLRVDIDGLPIEESAESEHVPAAEGFRSENDGFMHACGHDAHITFGLGVLDAVRESDFSGTFTVFFQPAEELLGGGNPMAAGPHLADVDFLLGVHVGLGSPGTVVAGLDEALAFTRFDVTFEGKSAHAGVAPNEGHNAVQALASAANSLYAIPRHEEGATRVNVGNLRSENAPNVIADHATMQAEVRAASNDLIGYMRETVRRYLGSAADRHECSVEVSVIGEAIRQDCSAELVDLVYDLASDVEGVSTVTRRDRLGGSEDATYLMKDVIDAGGKATYIGIGAGTPNGYHTPGFDVDEDALSIGVSVLSRTVLDLLE
ncbi:MAG: amidohydrolase [Halodesulfurarchaeum sp.]